MPIENQEKKYIRVTEVLSLYADSAYYIDEARDRGTAVHQWCAAFMKDAWCPIDPAYQAYCDSFQAWWETMKPIPFEVEKRYFHPFLGFSGQIDLIARLKGDEGFSLVDIKSGAAAATHPLQLGAYYELLLVKAPSASIRLPHEAITRFMTVHPQKDGRVAKVNEYTPADIIHGRNLFLSALELFKYFNGGEK